MKQRKRILAAVLITLYLLTWVGGWVSHAREIQSRAQRLWITAAARDRELERFAATSKLPWPAATIPHLRPGGPVTTVDWCLPVLPGLLLVDSNYVIGPLYAKGGIKLVLFYGFGSMELATICGWVS